MSIEIFPNSPLVEVVFEIRFPGDPVFECQRDKIFAEFKAEFPRVDVPTMFPHDRLPSFVPYKFVSEDGSESLAVAINSIFYSTSKYPGFDKFSFRALGILQRIAKNFPIKNLKRTGLRYVNLIPFSRENGTVPLRRFLNLEIKMSDSVSNEFQDINVGFVSKFEQGELTTRIGRSEKKKGGSGEAIVLDFDYAKTTNLDFKDIDKYMQESHDHTKKFFADLIAKEYLDVMRGKVL